MARVMFNHSTSFICPPFRVISRSFDTAKSESMIVWQKALKESIKIASERAEHKTCSQLELDFLQFHLAYAVLTQPDGHRLAAAQRFSFTSAVNPTFTVVIVVPTNLDLLLRSLASVILCGGRVCFEVVIVDTAKILRTNEILTLVDGARLLHASGAGRLVDICDICSDCVQSDYVVILNAGVEASPDWLDDFLLIFHEFKNAALLTPRVWISDGTLERIRLDSFYEDTNGLDYYGPAALEDSYVHETNFISDACIAMRMSALREFDVLGEGYKTQKFAKLDFGMRIDALNYKIVYTPFVVVTADISAFEKTNCNAETLGDLQRDSMRYKAWWHLPTQPQSLNSNLSYSVKGANVSRKALVLDAETPQPDKNAGGYAALQEIQLLQSLGFKCTFAPMDALCVDKYTQGLQRKGVQCLYNPYVSSINDYIQGYGFQFDLIYVTRYQVAKNSIAVIRKFAPQAKVILMIADLHFLRQIRSALYNRDEDELSVAIQTREDELAVMQKVDLVLTYSDIERAVIISHNLASSTVSKAPWVCNSRSVVSPFNKRGDIAFLGGFRHPPNLEAVLWFINKVMPLLILELPDVQFCIYGSDIPQELIDYSKSNKHVVIKGWVADITTVFDTCRVFVAPLQSGAGIKGKVISALASGVPSVLSPIAAEGIPIVERFHSVIAMTPLQWVKEIVYLYTCEAAWSAMSAAAHALASDQYSFEKAQGEMQLILDKLY